MRFQDAFLPEMADAMQRSFAAMDALERGGIANPSEQRMVGHYWLRTPARAPSPQIASEIDRTVSDIKAFAAAVHGGELAPPRMPRFTHVLVIRIGGSALGPMFVADALGYLLLERLAAKWPGESYR